MKKVLLASTALVAFAGAAAAEIAITGSAEMGVRGATFDVDFTDPTLADVSADSPLQFHQDVDVTFTMSGETDGGLAFGVSVDLDEGGGQPGVSNDFIDGGVAIFISGDFGTLTMGDTDGALDRVLTDAGNIGNPGSLDDAETSHLGYNGSWLDDSGDGQIVRYDYTFDAFQFAVSIEQHGDCNNIGRVTEVDDCDGNPNTPGGDDNLTWALGFGYEFEFSGGSVDLGIGYQHSDNGDLSITVTTESQIGVDVNGNGSLADDVGVPIVDANGNVTYLGSNVGGVDVIGVGAVVNLDNGFSGGFTYSDYNLDDFDDNLTHVGIGLGYAFDAFSVHFNYGQYDLGDVTLRGYGLAAGYDLGGGASLLFGWNQSDSNDIDFDGDGNNDDLKTSAYSFGLSFSF